MKSQAETLAAVFESNVPAPLEEVPSEHLAAAAIAETVAVSGVALPEADQEQRSQAGGWLSRLFGRRRRQGQAGPENHLQEVAGLIEAQGYARVAPRFSEQAADTTRTNVYAFSTIDPYDNRAIGEQTEYEGLVELRDFLSAQGGSYKAKGMLENLTFIGEKEYAEATEGLAAYWKRHLDSDPKAQLCVIAPVTGPRSEAKSDVYLMERILAHFTDDELKQYRGRLVVDLAHLTVPKDKVRIALLDDWIIGGSSMRNGYNTLTYEAPKATLDYLRVCTEINLITTTGRRIESGLYCSGERCLPVKAYFLAHDAIASSEYKDTGAHISGTHSSVDYDFRDPVGNMSRRGKRVPGLVYVTRAYRNLKRTHRERVSDATPKSRGKRR